MGLNYSGFTVSFRFSSFTAHLGNHYRFASRVLSDVVPVVDARFRDVPPTGDIEDEEGCEMAVEEWQ